MPVKGFKGYREACKHGKVWMEKAGPKTEAAVRVIYCLYAGNRVSRGGKEYVPACRQGICPYYKEEEEARERDVQA